MTDFLARSIKRLYDDCSRSLEDGSAQVVGGAIIDRYNELLEDAKEEYTDNRRIQNLEVVERTGAGVVPDAPPRPRSNDLQEVKFGLTTIADSIGLDLEDFRQVADIESFPVIEIRQNVTQSQTQQQTATQTVTFEQLYDELETRMAPQEEIEELRELLERLETELKSEDSDEEEVRRVIDSAKAFSSQMAIKMALIALERGVDILV